MNVRDKLATGNTRPYNPGEIYIPLRDAFLTVFYRLQMINSMEAAKSNKQEIARFTDNTEFWEAVLRGKIYPGARIEILGAHLTEWIPASPGRYFTATAKYQRGRANELYRANQIEGQLYDPYGKMSMIQGGIGTFRLNAELGSEPIYYLGLTTNGIAHQGIPVLLYQEHYDRVIQSLKQSGGCIINTIGRVQGLPTTFTTRPVSFANEEVPRYCFIPEEIEYLRESQPGELLTTVYVMFANSRNEQDRYDKAWTYCTFSPSPADGSGVEKAVQWLKRFADEYSRLHDPPILTDFDAYRQYFGHAIEFPLADIWANNISIEKLEKYGGPFGRVGHKLLTSEQRQVLGKALISAFPDLEALRRMVQFQLDTNLNALAVGGNLVEIMDKLILWADIADRIPDLLAAARAENPDNSVLQTIADQLSVLY